MFVAHVSTRTGLSRFDLSLFLLSIRFSSVLTEVLFNLFNRTMVRAYSPILGIMKASICWKGDQLPRIRPPSGMSTLPDTDASRTSDGRESPSFCRPSDLLPNQRTANSATFSRRLIWFVNPQALTHQPVVLVGHARSTLSKNKVKRVRLERNVEEKRFTCSERVERMMELFYQQTNRSPTQNVS